MFKKIGNYIIDKFTKEASFAYKVIFSFTFTILIVYLFFNNLPFSVKETFMLLSVVFCLIFTFVSIMDYIFVNLVNIFYNGKYKFKKPGYVVSGITRVFDPRKNRIVCGDNARNPALIMFDLMIREDNRVKSDPQLQFLVSIMADYCEEKVDFNLSFSNTDDPEGNAF